jgi:DNA-binding beta-propeller fold protein YncE
MPCHSSHYFSGFALLARTWRALTVVVMLTGAITVTAQTSITLPGDRDFPESITSTPDGTIYVGSLGTGGVYRIARGAKVARPWIKPGAFGTHSTFGVLADPKSNTLWVCSNDLSALGVTISGEWQWQPGGSRSDPKRMAVE